MFIIGNILEQSLFLGYGTYGDFLRFCLDGAMIIIVSLLGTFLFLGGLIFVEEIIMFLHQKLKKKCK